MNEKNFLRVFLEKLPAFQAIFRAVEASGLSAYGVKEPILDLGCGDGLFTQVLLGKGLKIIGLDKDVESLAQAKKRQIYEKLVKAQAENLPFPNNQFKTVLANSSLEHIKRIDPVLKEVSRVLAKGGSLILTAPSEKRSQYFAGQLHGYFFNHLNCWSGKKWQKKLKKIGFSKIEYRYLASNRTCFLSSLFFPFAFIGLAEKKLFGRFLDWRKLTAPVLAAFLGNFSDRVKGENGAVILVKATK